MEAFTPETDAAHVIRALGANADGKVVVITGPTEGGIGAQCAVSLAEASVGHIVLVGRSESKAKLVIDTIKARHPAVLVTFVQCDLSSVASINDASAAIDGAVPHIDILLNNAGVMAVRSLTISTDGNEMHLAANHLGHFLLTRNLLPKLEAAGSATVVNVTSQAYELSEVDFSDPNFEKRKYSPWVAYGQSKTANILHAFELGRRYGSKGIKAIAVHPGYIPGTKLQANTGVDMDLFMEGYKLTVERNEGKEVPPPAERTVSQGAAAVLSSALDPKIKSSSPVFIFEHRVVEAREYATNATDGGKLWEMSEKLVATRK